MVKIRLKRAGKKKKPFYSVVASDSRFPRDGRFIEKIGTYDPFTKKTDIKIDKYEKWIKNGAKCTATVESIIKNTERSLKQTVDVGKIIGVYGIVGEIKVKPFIDITVNLLNLTSIKIDEFNYEIIKTKQCKGLLILKLKDINDRNIAETLRGKILTANRVLLGPAGTIYNSDLFGIEVYTDLGKAGFIDSVFQTPASNIYSITLDEEYKKMVDIKSETENVLIPAVPNFIKSIDLENNKMFVEFIPGIY